MEKYTTREYELNSISICVPFREGQARLGVKFPFEIVGT